MKEFLIKLIQNAHVRELTRILPLLGLAGVVLIPDAGSAVVLYALGITLLTTTVSHVIRKILFPYVDLAEFAVKALETPQSAATVFMSVSILLGIIIFSTVMLLH